MFSLLTESTPNNSPVQHSLKVDVVFTSSWCCVSLISFSLLPAFSSSKLVIFLLPRVYERETDIHHYQILTVDIGCVHTFTVYASCYRVASRIASGHACIQLLTTNQMHQTPLKLHFQHFDNSHPAIVKRKLTLKYHSMNLTLLCEPNIVCNVTL